MWLWLVFLSSAFERNFYCAEYFLCPLGRPKSVLSLKYGLVFDFTSTLVMKGDIKGWPSYYRSTCAGVDCSRNLLLSTFTARAALEEWEFIKTSLVARR